MEIIHTIIQNAQEVIASLLSYAVLKFLLSWTVIAIAYVFGRDHVQLIGLLTVLVLFNMGTGIFSAFKTKQAITSKKMIKTAVKWTLYMVMVSTAYLTDKIIPGDWYLIELTLAFLAATEGVSILENIGKCGVAVPFLLLNRLDDFRAQKTKS